MREKQAKVGEKCTKNYRIFWKGHTLRWDYRTKEESRIRPDHVFKEKQGQVNLWRKLIPSRCSDSSTLHSYCSFIQVHKPKNDTYYPVLSVKGD